LISDRKNTKASNYDFKKKKEEYLGKRAIYKNEELAF